MELGNQTMVVDKEIKTVVLGNNTVAIRIGIN